MAFTLEQFSRKQTLDLSTAIATAVARHMKDALFPGPGGVGSIQLAEVFADWPSYEQAQLSPAGCILPDSALVYDEAYPTPFLLDETWEPVGAPGFGMYALSEVKRDLDVVVRAATSPERNALVAGIEGLFFRPEISALPGPSRYGVLLTMPEYFDLPVRVSLAESRKMDNAESAVRNVWESQILLRTQAKHCVVRPVRPFNVNIHEIVGTDPIT